jgi:hypothetical protein
VRVGVKKFLWSPAGRAESRAHLMQKWQDQDGICPKCNTRMALLDCKFESKEFVEGEENRAIHKGKCTNDAS